VNPRCRIVGLAVITAAALPQLAGAQSAGPYTSSLRSEFSAGQEQREALRGGLFEPRIEAALYFVNNIELTDVPADEVDLAGVEAAPGFYAAYNGARATGAIDYSLIGRAWEDSDYNDVSHRLSSNGEYAVVPELFYIQGSATYEDAVIDPAAGANYGGLGIFGDTNITEVATASVSPYLEKRFNDFQLDARYSYGRVWYLDNEPSTGLLLNYDDSEDQTILLSVSTAEQDGAVDGRVFYEWQASDFERSVPYRYERAGAEMGFRLTETLRFVGDGGMETDLDVSTQDGGLDTEYWHAGLLWTPDSRTTAEARYGQRFFGDSYLFRLSREVRDLTFDLSYSEDPEVETRRLSLGEIDPGNLPPRPPGFDLSFASSYPFILRAAQMTVRAEGARTRVSLSGYDIERDYIRAFPADETTIGTQLRVVRDFTADTYGELRARYEEVEQGIDLNSTSAELRTYYDSEYLLRLTYEGWVNLAPSAEAGYLLRGGDTNYEGYWLALRFVYVF